MLERLCHNAGSDLPKLLWSQRFGLGPALLVLWMVLASCTGVPKPAVIITTGPSAAQTPPVPGAPGEPLEASSLHTLPPIHFTIQVGAFSTPERAARETVRLQQSGLDAYFYLDSDDLYKVRFERFDTAEAARMRAMELVSGGLIDAFFIARPGSETAVDDPVAFLRGSIVQTGHRFLGMPYRWGGASEDDGFDCSGLTMTVYRLNGLDLPRNASHQYRAGTAVAREALAPGDLVFFATSRGNAITHVGIYSGEDNFIHAPGRGKSIQTTSLSSDYFKKRFVGARRYF
jgi:hypothetical protein